MSLAEQKETTMNKKYPVAVATAALALSLSACGSPAWQDALADHLAGNAEDIDDACGALAMLDVTTPEKVGALVLAFDESDLPAGSTTIGEYLASQGRSVDDLPYDMPADVTIREVANEAGAIVLDMCEY